MTDLPAGAPIDSQQSWTELNQELPVMLEELLGSRPFGVDCPPQNSGRGIYLFSHGEDHFYVGRTGITARARKAGKEPGTSFGSRWKQHCGERSSPERATFAMKIAYERAESLGIQTPRDLKASSKVEQTVDWWKLRGTPEEPEFCAVFQEAKRFIRDQLAYRVLELEDDVRGVRSYVAEVYVDVSLQTRYGDFSTS